MGEPLVAKFFVYDKDDLAYYSAKYTAQALIAAVAKNGRASLAVSGGSTRHMLEMLANNSRDFGVPWGSVWLFFVDERLVPPSHEDSNYKMVKQALIDKVELPGCQVFRIRGELEPAEAAKQYCDHIREYFGGEPRFDILQLGMGEDGHTASLFPNTLGLEEEEDAAVANYIARGFWRVTLTKAAINSAANVFFLVSGGSKAQVLKRVLEGPLDEKELPAQLVSPPSGLAYFLDKEAASLLEIK